MVLIAAIRTKTEELRITIHSINDDSGPNGKANNFEEAAKYIAKYIPDAKETKLLIKALDTKVGGRDYLDSWDDEGRSLSEAERKAQKWLVLFTPILAGT